MVVSALVFRPSLPLATSRLKAFLLRAFGARVGKKLTIKPSVNIKYPWFLEVGDNVWIGEEVWLDNPGRIKIGANVCISQGSYLVTGNHNFKSPSFEFFAGPIEVGDRCWLCARSVLPPGSRVEPGAIVPIGAVWRNSVEGP